MERINVKSAPAPIGPYSHAVRAGDLLYLSGQGPLDPASGAVIGSSMAEQTSQTMINIRTTLKEMGLGFKDVVKATVFLTRMESFSEFNAVYGEFFGPHLPARTTVELPRLPKDIMIEIDIIATFK